MKKLIGITIWLVFLAWSMGFAQSPSQSVIYKVASLTGVVTKVDSLAYTVATIDTSISYTSALWSIVQVYIQSHDSASCVLKYQTSYNGKNWSVATIKDSLKTAGNTGDGKTIDISSLVCAAPYFRFILGFNSGAPQGTTSNRYTAWIVRRNY